MEYRTISKDELTAILAKHKEWLEDSAKGERANLRYANLRYADLRYADLRYADLRSANLSSANLNSADLRSANLSSANLSYANLSSANLSYANLSSANLRYADLRSADLRYADLRSADLLIFQYQRHVAYFTMDGTMRIGCHCMPITEWVIGYKEVARANAYSEIETEAYGDFIRLCLKVFEAKAPPKPEGAE